MKDAIRKDLQSRYTDPLVKKALEISCALDPRFRSLPYYGNDLRSQIYDEIILLLTENQVRVKKEPGTDADNNDNPTPQLPTLQGDSDLQDISMENEAETQSSPDGSPVRKKSTMEALFGDIFVTKFEPAKPQ